MDAMVEPWHDEKKATAKIQVTPRDLLAFAFSGFCL
ncbi:hypothetical protein Q669_09985 [Labrenzia sp. C1B10]|nr:hypothetical protein Q669_09985 [Labrenzia sp. C1B10]ERP99274.1 hypothetical protein Q675_11925 [Labrenzia sp. C1B70]